MKIAIKHVEQFNELLIKRGFNKTEFSKVIDLSQPMFNQISNGLRNPSPRTARRICEVLNVEFEEIFCINKAEVITEC
ncbi:helix-turn-helix transcriptional regulator [Terribacillus saccharophilus]|uniref:helix-turn-helix transcriptional regulator n=1 Tax=Terribacillus saccharophilus TaxID=361277 RepID=UPI000C9B44C1